MCIKYIKFKNKTVKIYNVKKNNNHHKYNNKNNNNNINNNATLPHRYMINK